LEIPEQGAKFPVIAPGVAGIVLIVIGKLWTPEEPQPLFAFTVTLPLVEFVVAEMEFVVDVPVQPVGSVQVYDVDPATGDTL
jgi:hypothetical protein